jgi:GNAT superfamily N-acetyltransferase
MIRVRRIRPGEGAKLRDIRCRALTDAPSAFASTLESESVRPQSVWEEAAERRSEGSTSATFIAESGDEVDEWVGLVGAFRLAERPRVVELVSLWVEPAARRAGIGRRLVDELASWARATGSERVELWVTRGNEPAIELYTSAGFALTGDHQPLRRTRAGMSSEWPSRYTRAQCLPSPDFGEDACVCVPGVGFEPTCPFGRGGLSPSRLTCSATRARIFAQGRPPKTTAGRPLDDRWSVFGRAPAHGHAWWRVLPSGKT